MGKIRKTQHVVFAAIGLLALAMSGAEAATRDPDLPPPDPKGYWRKLTHDDATSTSRCLGQLATPMCAVETVLAGKLRGREDWYQHARGASESPWPAGTPEPPDRWVKYRIVSSGHFKAGDPRQDDRSDDLGWEPGDVWIVVDAKNCDGETWCAKPAPSMWRYLIKRFVVHKRMNDWIVMYMRDFHWKQ